MTAIPLVLLALPPLTVAAGVDLYLTRLLLGGGAYGGIVGDASPWGSR
ncbi:MAG: hypothetical protein OSA81_07680 [Longimicrobiales bacterium]|nr:hypothetical protein [Longimicrobiales bacterium]